jgi:hypothetical protein
MGKKSAPDYEGAAEQTAASDRVALRDQTYANRANQYTPDGSKTWESYQDIDPATGEPVTRWNETVTFSPEQQAIYDKGVGISDKRMDVGVNAADRLMSEYGDPIDWSGASPWAEATTYGGPASANHYRVGVGDINADSGTAGDPNDYRQAGEDASYQSQMRRIDPQYDDQTTAMELQMRNQGLNPDDRAWQNQMRAMSDSYNDASQSARLASAAEGRMESALNWGQQQDTIGNTYRDTVANQNFGLGKGNIAAQMAGINSNADIAAARQTLGQNEQQFNQAMALRQAQNQETMTQRGFGLNELNAMVSGQQVGIPQFGGYNAAGRAAPTDYMGAATNEGNFNQGMNNNFWDAAGQIGGGYASTFG